MCQIWRDKPESAVVIRLTIQPGLVLLSEFWGVPSPIADLLFHSEK